MRKIILCDVDHTLFDSSWRDHMVGGPGGVNWDEYHEAADRDPPSVVLTLIKELIAADHNRVFGLTAIPEKWRWHTRDRLLRHGIIFEHLIMRPPGNHDPSPVVKLVMTRRSFDLANVAFLLEDRDDVTQAFRDAGVTVLQVHLTKNHAPSVAFGGNLT